MSFVLARSARRDVVMHAFSITPRVNVNDVEVLIRETFRTFRRIVTTNANLVRSSLRAVKCFLHAILVNSVFRVGCVDVIPLLLPEVHKVVLFTGGPVREHRLGELSFQHSKLDTSLEF
jgi:hypothetical protein